MEKRVELEMRGKNPEEILELTLDNCRSTQIAGITDELKNLEFLSLVNVGLTTLKGFPNLANLKRLELSDNRLTGGLEHLSGCPNMTHLNLSGNKLKDVASLEPLKTLTHLKSLDLFNCEVTSEEGYREKVFEILGHLKFLDGFDKEEKECDDSDDGLDDDDEEDAGPEDGTDEEEEDDPGLAYLHSDRAVVDEDETEDFELSGNNEADEDDDDDEHDDEEEESGEGTAGRGSKRKFEEETSN